MNKWFLQYKYLLLDTLWNNKGLVVPLGTTIGSSIWFLIEPGPEPIVLIVTSVLAALVFAKEGKDQWHSSTQGHMYEIVTRSDTLSRSERNTAAKQFLEELEFYYKYQFVPGAGDGPNHLVVDTIINNENEFIEKTRKAFYVYFINKDGKTIYEKEY
ncbi:MAG: hypothetical protein PF439_06795 [Helicobacteraceae bacterium]|jgi:hypothetical protein|nr:hypothetical protein [Helicobacteraceae bacterium]